MLFPVLLSVGLAIAYFSCLYTSFSFIIIIHDNNKTLMINDINDFF